MTSADFAKARGRVVIHEDDVGMTHGANRAFAELSALGTCSSGSVMAPCPWFPEAVEMAAANRSLDVGVHLTLTSEKRLYRWRPLTAPPRSAGLTDDLGYFWPDVPRARGAAPDAVEAELRAQIEATLQAGVDVTHLDAHMGTALCPEFVEIYFRLGRDYRLPILLVRDYNTYNPRSYSGPLSNDRYDAVLAQARAAGSPIFEVALETPWQRKTDAETAYRAMFDAIPDGLSFLSLHFNAPGDFEVIEPDYAHIRTEEYALFKTPRIAQWLRERHLEVTGMRDIRDDLRAARAAQGRPQP
ncbi:MAG: polysaccharide deacetylase family protein [Methylobacteriaceae bacterium]|nr:polysaccharide deacetylase family protein [Methylobacteriaceae bacterium]